MSETIARRISGHTTWSVFDRYTIMSEDDLRDAATKLTDFPGTLWAHLGN